MSDGCGDGSGKDGASVGNNGDKRDAVAGDHPVPLSEDVKEALNMIDEDSDVDAVVLMVASTKSDPPRSKGTVWHKDTTDFQVLLAMMMKAIEQETGVVPGAAVN